MEPRNGNQDQTIAQVDGQRNVAAWKRFEKLVPRLDQGTPIEPWIQDVRRLKHSDPEEFWEIMCLHVPANIFEDVMAIWTAADGQGEAKLDKAFSRLRRMLGKHKSAVEAMQTVQNFEKEEDKPATTAIMRFNQLVRDYESMCKEEDVTPVNRNGKQMKKALIDGFGLGLQMVGFQGSLEETCERVKDLMWETDKLKAKKDKVNAMKFKNSRGAAAVQGTSKAWTETIREIVASTVAGAMREFKDVVPRPTRDTPKAKRPKTEDPKGPPCFYFVTKGSCKSGDQCQQSHVQFCQRGAGCDRKNCNRRHS